MAERSRAKRPAGGALTTRPPSDAVGRGTTQPSSWALGEGQAVPWEYAPAPEARDVVSHHAAARNSRAVTERQISSATSFSPRLASTMR